MTGNTQTATVTATETDVELAPTRSGYSGGYVPGRLVAFAHNGRFVCPDCASDVTVTAPDGDGEIPMDEYPADKTDPSGFGVGVQSGLGGGTHGSSCDVCHRKFRY